MVDFHWFIYEKWWISISETKPDRKNRQDCEYPNLCTRILGFLGEEAAVFLLGVPSFAR